MLEGIHTKMLCRIATLYLANRVRRGTKIKQVHVIKEGFLLAHFRSL